MKVDQFVTLAALASLLVLAQPFAGSTTQVNASVTVICPFGLSLSMLSTYPRVPIISVNYTATATSACAVGNLTGSFKVLNSSSNAIVYQEPVGILGNGHPQLHGSVSFSTSNMANSSYTGLLSLDVGPYTASTQNTFVLLNYANVLITQFSAPQSVGLGAALPFFVSLQNVGQVASSPITLSLHVAGPQPFNTVYVFSALSPGQSSNTTIALANETGVAGSYNATLVATYNSLGQTENSTPATVSYSVTVPQQSIPVSTSTGGLPVNVTNLPPNLVFTYMPLIISGQPGTIEQSQIGLRNTGPLEEQIGLGVPGVYSGLLGLSSYSVSLAPNESTTVQVFLKPNLTLQTGVYTVPINVSVVYQGGGMANITEYITFSLFRQNATQPSISTQMYRINSTGTASGVISIIAPRGRDISNTTLVQWIPASVAANLSDLSFYGLPTVITLENGTYKVVSYIGNLPRNQTLYEYYSIKGAIDPQLMLRSQYEFYTLSQTNSSSILRLAGISAPTVTSNSIGIITVSVLYTGTKPANVSFYAVPPPQITLQNYTQNASAVPNELLVKQFKIIGHSSNGTFILQLYIRTLGANLSYGIPILINPPPQFKPSQSTPLIPFYLRVAIFIVLIVIVIALLRSRFGGRQTYSSERAGRLVRIKEQIKRERE